jgi:hypothetical protein
LFAAAVVCTLAVAGSARGEMVLYRETFGNDASAGFREAADYGWQCYYGTFGRPVGAYDGTQSPPPVYRHTVTDLPGRPAGLPGINAGATFGTDGGFWAFEQTWPYNAGRLLLFTDEYAINRATWAVSAASWHQGNDNDAEPAESRVAIRIGGQWYASTQVFTGADVPPGAFGSSPSVAHHMLPFTSAAAAWRPLIFDPDVLLQLTLEEQLAAPLPDGDITAFGLYIRQNGSDFQAVDTFQIEAMVIPEPVTAALLGVGLSALLLRRRRH